MVNWKNKKDKEIKEEFRHLLIKMAQNNGANDLIDVVEGIPNIKQKRDFVIGWHEQDE